MIPLLSIPAPTFNEFGIYYFVFGLMVAMGIIMLGVILLADPDPQYDIDSLNDIPEDASIPQSGAAKQ